MKIVSAETSQVLSVKIAQSLGVGVVETRFKSFPDGELYVRIGDPDNHTVIVGSVVDSNSFLQLLLLIDACEDSRITLVVPYMGYARQDRKFNPGEPVSARAVARALSEGVDEVYTVNIHKESVLDHFRAPASNLSLAPSIGMYLERLGLDNPLILGPDAGASAFAAAVAGAHGWDCDYLHKSRLSGEEVRMEPKNLNAAGREVVIVDDIIATGGTIATAAGMLYEQKAKAVHAACVHGVFTGGAFARLNHAGITSIAASDTIESGCSTISAADCIAGALRRS